MNGVRVLRRDARVDQRIETSEADTATAFHTPEGSSTAQRCEDRERFVGPHVGGFK
jgi:hypothetical protein